MKCAGAASLSPPCKQMNIFALSKSPRQSAMYHGDKHVVKMLLESCQMLYSVHWVLSSSLESAPLAKNGQHGYKLAHKNHPCTKWARESRANYLWLAALAVCLAEEYEFRWPGRVHSCKEHALWLKENVPPLAGKQTPFAVAMDLEYKLASPIASYRNYYIKAKMDKRGKYTRREMPWFLTP